MEAAKTRAGFVVGEVTEEIKVGTNEGKSHALKKADLDEHKASVATDRLINNLTGEERGSRVPKCYARFIDCFINISHHTSSPAFCIARAPGALERTLCIKPMCLRFAQCGAHLRAKLLWLLDFHSPHKPV